MPHPSSNDDLNAWGQYRLSADEGWHGEPEVLKGGHDEVPVRLLRCPICFKDLAARETCSACGDEEQAA